MDPKLIKTIANQVYKRFPEVAGEKPKVRKRRPPKAAAGDQPPTYLLTFRGTGKGPGGRTIPRLVRVVADARGKILKITTSRG